MLLDIGVGILLTFFISAFQSVLVTGLFIGGGIIFALLPDTDSLLHLSRGGTSRNAARHREGLHYPLIYIPAGALLLSPFGTEWALLFVLASFAHFLHDSIGIGWGVQWLWPLREDHYSFFYIYKPRHRSERLPRKLLYVWEHASIEELNARYGDEEWIKNIYLKWHPYAVAELAVFLVALAVLFSWAS